MSSENSAVFLQRTDIWFPSCVTEFQVEFLDAAVTIIMTEVFQSPLEPM